ncbi:MAG: hypothetical protein DYH05_07210 [Acidobacteria bacterium ACB1]|nr:hypothetical protein [Acidobacteria bacterium ACB1]RIJ89022.1 MAG: hypothetical protein DCC44_12395 [Acidobacteriota bacterium]
MMLMFDSSTLIGGIVAGAAVSRKRKGREAKPANSLFPMFLQESGRGGVLPLTKPMQETV